ncbi:MAG: beta-hydroxyacyl-ACP dehydratase [Candidatus Kerfeldbacteria bacterium]|nr:beta-hydroxyacyl-ACP dehydratase [Candidatus Kerfeldbacteria bacterium]
MSDSTLQAAGVVLEARQIIGFIPHRLPALLVQRVTILDEQRARGTMRVGHRVCDGHFPEHEIFPGHWWPELAAQTVGVMIGHDRGGQVNGWLHKFTVEVIKPAAPGDTLVVEVVLTRVSRASIEYAAQGFVNDELAYYGPLNICVLARRRAAASPLPQPAPA